MSVRSRWGSLEWGESKCARPRRAQIPSVTSGAPRRYLKQPVQRSIRCQTRDLSEGRTQASITPITVESRIILASPRLTVPFGLLVSRVLGLRRVGEVPRDTGQGGQIPWHAGERVDEVGAVWQTIDMTRLAGDPDFYQAANRSDRA